MCSPPHRYEASWKLEGWLGLVRDSGGRATWCRSLKSEGQASFLDEAELARRIDVTSAFGHAAALCAAHIGGYSAIWLHFWLLYHPWNPKVDVRELLDLSFVLFDGLPCDIGL